MNCSCVKSNASDVDDIEFTRSFDSATGGGRLSARIGGSLTKTVDRSGMCPVMVVEVDSVLIVVVVPVPSTIGTTDDPRLGFCKRSKQQS